MWSPLLDLVCLLGNKQGDTFRIFLCNVSLRASFVVLASPASADGCVPCAGRRPGEPVQLFSLGSNGLEFL